MLASIAFGALWYRWKKLPYLLWLMLAFLLHTLGALTQILFLPPDYGLNAICSCLFYSLGTLAFSQSYALRLGRKPQLLFQSCLAALILVTNAFFFYGSYNLVARIYTQNFGYGFMLLVTVFRIGGIPKKLVDRIVYWVLVSLALQFFLRTFISVQYSNFGEFTRSTYWVFANFFFSIFSLLLSLTMLATVVVDVIDELKRTAHTDPLTGLLNRRGFETFAARVLSRQRYHPACLVFCDIDHFKNINDSYGHAEGDTVLSMVASLFRQQLRPLDAVGRIGGEEFALLLPQADTAQAYAIAERLRAKIAALRIGAAASPDRTITASFGIAAHIEGEQLTETMQRADRMLYAAKHEGRNRTVVYGNPGVSALSKPKPQDA